MLGGDGHRGGGWGGEREGEWGENEKSNRSGERGDAAEKLETDGQELL